MYELITDKTLAEYEAFLQSHPKGHFAQSSLWAKQKPMWTWDAVAVRGEDGKIKGSLALMTRRVPGIGRTLMYGCRGPVCDLDDRETFAQLLEGAKALAKKYKSYVIKLDPDVPSSNTAFAALMQSFGFRCKEGGKNFEAIQPRYVFRLNVEGKTEDELMAAFHQKWRYNIRLAERKGVSVKICGKEMVPAFADLMLTTGVRDGFVTRKPEYFANMLDNLGEHARLYMAFDPEGAPIAKLLQAMQEGRTEMCVVVDEHGGTAGIVTMSDIMEQIVGRVDDEYSHGLADEIVKKGDGRYLIDGSLSIDDLEDLLGFLPEEANECETAAGILLAAFDRIPEEGDTVSFTGRDAKATFTVADMDRHRVDKILVRVEQIPREDAEE